MTQLLGLLKSQVEEKHLRRTKIRVVEEESHEESYEENLTCEYNGKRNFGVVKRRINDMDCFLEHCRMKS